MSTQLNVKSIPDGSITRYKLENRLQEQLQEQFDNLKYFTESFTESYNLIRDRVDSHETNLGKVNNTLTRLQKSEYYTFTYDELIDIRGSFKPGAYYIITDFTTILTDSYRTNNNISSYRYNLQIILRAKNNNELYETGLLFFESDNLSDNILSEWKIWYSLDNDTNRFEWANPDNGRGVIYRMIDGNGNDLPYDAINIRFNNKYTFNCERYENDDYVNYNCLLKNYHNFKVFNNVIKPYVVNGVQKLNKILFTVTTSSNCSNNIIENNCHDITFNRECTNNTIAKDSFNLSFDHSTTNNTINTECQNNTFGYNFDGNIIKSKCQNNTFGYGVKNNTIGFNFNKNTLGNFIENCSFGDFYTDNSFGSYMQYNSFGNGINYSVFGDFLYNNVIGNMFVRGKIGSNAMCINIGSGCEHIYLGEYVTHTSIGDGCYHISIVDSTKENLLNYCKYIKIDTGCSYIKLYTENSTSYSNCLLNIYIKLGFSGNSSNLKEVKIDSLNSQQQLIVSTTSLGEITIYSIETVLETLLFINESLTNI